MNYVVTLCRDCICMMREPIKHRPQCHALVYSHSSHPLIAKGHKGDAQPLHGDAVLLSIKLICPLLF